MTPASGLPGWSVTTRRAGPPGVVRSVDQAELRPDHPGPGAASPDRVLDNTNAATPSPCPSASNVICVDDYPVRTTVARSAFTLPPRPRDVRAELSASDRRMQPPRAAGLAPVWCPSYDLANGAAPGHVLVATKLHVPQPRERLVARPELVARLLSGHGRKLTLICAPAGWGKTVLLSQWHASPEETRPFAWVSLERGDSDPARFWSYAIGALRTIEPKLGERALAALPAAGPDLADVVVAPLINDLAATGRALELVLDDYHLLRGEALHDSVASFLRHLPPGVQLAIASRADPPLPLARLRAAGEITEIRAAELRFSAAEADAFLNNSLALGLDTTDVQRLQARTEGWAAGLQLAGLSLQAQADRHAFVVAFAGDERHIGEYLHEVLREQPEALREFLLRSSILERMCARLCDAVTSRNDAAEQLATAERGNLFLVPLDPRREWFRYHHLFR